MKLKYLLMAVMIFATLLLGSFSVSAVDTLTLLPPPDSQKYAPLTAKTTRVYVVETKNVYMACKVDIPADEIDCGYIFINQSLAFSKFDSKDLEKGIFVDNANITNGYIVFNMKDYKGVIENKAPNRIAVCVQKTDGSLVFSNLVLLTIASGEMSCESSITGEMVTYSIEEGFLPIDPATINLTANGNALSYYYNRSKKTITAFVTAGKDGDPVQNLRFSVKDLKGKSVTVEDQVKLDETMNSLRNKFTKIGFARYVFPLSGYELSKQPYKFNDIDYIPYDSRAIVSTLAAKGLLVDKNNGVDYFNTNDEVTQKMIADFIFGLTKRALYVPEDETAVVALDEAIDILLKVLETR